MRRFYRAYPLENPESELEWSKHVILLTIKNDVDRNLMERKALEENLTRWQLKKQVKLYHMKRDRVRIRKA